MADDSAYNIGVLDHLLAMRDAGAHAILDRLCRKPDELAREFLDAYLTDGARAVEAIAYMSPRTPGLLQDLVSTMDLSEPRRIELVNAALMNISEDTVIEYDEDVRGFLQSNYHLLSGLALVEQAPDEDAPKPIAAAFEPTAPQIRVAMMSLQATGAVLKDLAPLRSEAGAVAVELSCYELDAHNLRIALGDPEALSLDAIQGLNAAVFEYVLANPEDYLTAVGTDLEPPASEGVGDDSAGNASALPSPRTRHTIQDPAAFASVVGALSGLSNDVQTRILAQTVEGCAIEDLRSVPYQTWEALAELRKFPATVENLDAYIDFFEVDEHLASLLAGNGAIEPRDLPAEEPTEDDERADDDMSVRVALAVINASSQLPSPKVRTDLAATIGLRYYLDVDLIGAERGELLGHLIRTKLCHDSESTFAHFDVSDWPTLSFGIKHSTDFFRFATASVLNSQMVAELLDDDEVPEGSKKQVLSRFDSLVPADDAIALHAAARAALATRYTLSLSQIASIVDGTKDGQLAVGLLYQRNEITSAEAVDLLARARDPYDALSASGSELKFPNDPPHKWLLKRLQSDHLLTFKVISKSKLRSARIDVLVM